jgi:uncharacterized protein (TIGR02646 family)
MKHIVKKAKEPEEFTDWKHQEHDTLEVCYNKHVKPADCAWNHLPSNMPDVPENKIVYYTKTKLKAELLDEQGFICAFCMEKLENNAYCTLDHLVPKSDNARDNTFNYYNLLVACSGINDESGNKKLKDDLRHCNNKKGNYPIKVSPLDPICEQKFNFTIDGNIYPNNENDIDAITTIGILGLSSPILVRKRKEAIDRKIYPNLPTIDKYGNIIENSGSINNEDAKELLGTIDQKLNSAFEPFCMAIKYVLENNF